MDLYGIVPWILLRSADRPGTLQRAGGPRRRTTTHRVLPNLPARAPSNAPWMGRPRWSAGHRKNCQVFCMVNFKNHVGIKQTIHLYASLRVEDGVIVHWFHYSSVQQSLRCVEPRDAKGFAWLCMPGFFGYHGLIIYTKVRLLWLNQLAGEMSEQHVALLFRQRASMISGHEDLICFRVST